MTTFSIIIPAYNGDRYIQEAIESVFAQTYRDYEIIVVDDGSTDETQKIVVGYGDRIQYIYQSNQGVSQARNRGLVTAKGKYIAFLDQDDLFLPDKLASGIALLEQQPSLGIINSGWQIINQEKNVTSAVQPWLGIPELNLVNFITWKPVFLGAMLFSHAWLNRTNGFDPELTQTPDVDLVLRLVAMGCQADWVKKNTVVYRQHEANASKNASLQAQELDYVLERFFHNPELSPQIKTLEAKSRYQSLVWSAWRLYSLGNVSETINYLTKSCNYSKKHPTATIMDWIQSFQHYSGEYGETIDVSALCLSPEWQNLIQNYVFN